MNTKEILQEIYKVDSDMKNHEKELEKIIAKLIEEKPDLEIDQAFIKKLKEKVMSEENPSLSPKISMNRNIFTWPKLSFSLAGAALMFLLMLPFTNIGENIQESRIASDEAKNKNRIAKLDEKAFGSLVLNEGDEDYVANEMALKQSPVPSANKSAGDDSSLAADSMEVEERSVAGMGIGAGGGGAAVTSPMVSDSKMIAPNFERYEYKFTGKKIDLGDSMQSVYRRANSSNYSSDLDVLVDTISDGLFAAEKLENIRVDSMNVAEDKEFGLVLYYNSQNGSIDLNQNWTKWPRTDEECRSEECFMESRLKIEDVPADSKIIEIANNFVSEYNIDMNAYGEPELNDYWRENYERSENKNSYYIPENIQVVYPYIIEGEKVYGEGGQAFGLMVEVNIRYNKVSGVHTLKTTSYESSDYKIETDFARIVELAEKGASGRVYFDQNEDVDTVLVELGTPEKILIVNYLYQREKGENQELYMPALRFPVINQPEGLRYFNREYVVVPLVEEILNNRHRYIDEAMPVEPLPMPLMRGEEIEPALPEREEQGIDSGEDSVMFDTGVEEGMMTSEEQ